MSKLDELRKSAGQNVRDSTGDPLRITGATPASAGPPARYRGVSRSKDAVMQIPLDRIVADPDQPRREFDEASLRELAASLKENEQLQAARVRWDEGQGVYVILMGERRFRAAALAGLANLDCVVQEGELTASDRLALQLVENLQREDLKPVEEAHSYRRLMEVKGWSTREVAAALSIAQSSVVRALALLDLPEEVQAAVEQGALGPTVAYEVAKQLDRPEEQIAVAQAAVEQGLLRAEVSELAQAVRAKRPAPTKPTKPAPVEIDLGDGVLVRITYRRPSTMPAAAALRRASKILADRDRAGEGEAA